MKIKTISGIEVQNATVSEIKELLSEYSKILGKLYHKNPTTTNIDYLKSIIRSIYNIGEEFEYLSKFHRDELKIPKSEYLKVKETKKLYNTVLSDTGYYIRRAIYYLENNKPV